MKRVGLIDFDRQPDLRVVVAGSASSQGRKSHLLKLRPSLVENLKRVAHGPVYLLAELAIERFIADLDGRPRRQVEMVEASDMAAGHRDFQLLDLAEVLRHGEKETS